MSLRLVCAVLLALPMLGASGAQAASDACAALQGERIRFVVPNGVGGGYDAQARLIQPFLQRELGARIRLDNRPEAGGLVGARAIRNAAPDGRTLGIINATGLLAARLADPDVPDPAREFTVLARIARNETVLLTGANSGLGDLESLLRASRARPMLIGVRDAGSASVFAIPVAARLLGMDYELVTGLVGSNARILAAVRGDVDLLVQSFDSARQHVASGELRVLLTLGGAAPGDPLLRGVPTLAEAVGRRYETDPRALERGRRQADALMGVIDAGRVIVAPRGLPESLRSCLQARLGRVLGSAAIRENSLRAGLTLEPASAAAAGAGIEAARASLQQLAPLVEGAVAQARR